MVICTYPATAAMTGMATPLISDQCPPVDEAMCDFQLTFQQLFKTGLELSVTGLDTTTARCIFFRKTEPDMLVSKAVNF